ncbi:hypothetical protein TNCV_3599011 [Trichonephila clavipes]|nr:hypothetical protein TNCV_3599011 [Trichonephila clavipes]
MHLPLIRTGISVKAGSSFPPPTVASTSATCRLFSSSYRLRKKIVFFFPLRFGVPRTRFGAVKPSLPALFPSRPRDVTLVSFSFGRFLPPASPLRGGVN